MKKIFTFLIFLSAVVINAQIPAYVPTNGLVGYYPFNGNANDESGNGNNGTVNGASLTNDRFGNNNSAYNFANNYISLSQPFFNGSTNVNSLTYSIWFKCSQLPSSSTAYSLSTKEGFWRSIGLEINANGLVSYSGSQPSPQSYFSVSSQNSIVLNQWNHIIVTFENSTLKLYLNGNLESTIVIQYSTLDYSYLALGNSTSTNLIGATNPVSPGLTNFTNGIIDDFGIWNRALTQQEITNLYNSSLPQTTCLPAYVPGNGLVGYWPFCGNANDESGNGNNGTLGNGVNSVADRFGLSNSAYTFTGSGNISLTNLPTTSNSDFTITGWIKTDSQNLRKGIACWGQDTPWASTYFFVNSSGFLEFDFAYNGGPISTINLTDNSWHFVSATCNGGLVKLYVDSAQTGNTLQMSPNIMGNNKSLGSNIDNSGQNNFVGSLDDIGIWNRALTQQEIASLYTATLNTNAVSQNNEISIYPNPAKDRVTIDCSNLANVTGYQIKIVNTLGQEVYSGAMNTPQVVVPINSWSGIGVYFVKIYDASNSLLHTKKIIVQ